MTPTEFETLSAQGYNRIPLTLETYADLDTPLSLYVKLAAGPNSYLLESVQGGERFGRYSIIGLPSATRIEVQGREVVVKRGEAVVTHEPDTDPLQFIETFTASFRVPALPRLPRSCGGLVGYFGYDTIRHIEPRLKKGPQAGDLGTPDMLFVLSEEVAVVDNLSGKLTLVVYADPALPNAYTQAQARLSVLLNALRSPVNIPESKPGPSAEAISCSGQDAFKAAVLKAKAYILEGDIMQVVLSQRMHKPYRATPLALYRALRSLNPSPYLYFLDLGDFQVVGSSPEILVRLEGHGEEQRVVVRPIAGTRKRGSTPEEDSALAAELLADQKELAEHTQLLDLGRNDAGRVSEVGSVRVTEHLTVERYSHVMHIVSNVEGRLKAGLKAMDVLRATFPAGTVSGAAKVRAMEIIDELEPVKRGIYAGAVGYLGFHGEMDMAIAIRTAILKDGELHVQAGAGIVADSDPEAEWQETCNKARAVLRAAELAEQGLDTVR